MSISDAWQNIESHFKSFLESAQQRAETDLPEVAAAVEKLVNDPVFLAITSAVHLPAAPEAVQAVVSLINGLDAALGAEKERAAAAAQQASQEQPAAM